MKFRYVLAIVAIITLTLVLSVKIAVFLMIIGVVVMLLALTIAATCISSIDFEKCTDDNSPLANAIWGDEPDDNR